MVREAEKNDAVTLAELAVLLWSEHSTEELAQEFSQLMDKNGARFFLKYEESAPVGFAQCQLRHDYVEGTKTSPVGYLEGIFVKEDFRCKGYARELLSACESWARTMGCTEFASDCEIHNDDSRRFHEAMRFRQVNRIICFAKEL